MGKIIFLSLSERLEGRQVDQGHVEEICRPQRAEVDLQVDIRRCDDFRSRRIELSGESRQRIGAAGADKVFRIRVPEHEAIQLFKDWKASLQLGML